MKLSLPIFILSCILSAKAFSVDLSVMVLYHSDFSAARNPSTTIATYINDANAAYANSGMPISLKLAHRQQINLPNSKSVGSKILDQLERNSKVWDLQDKYRPDITVYITNDTSDLCGKARFPKPLATKFPKYEQYISQFNAVASSAFQCGSRTFIHEIGHVLGAGHGAVRQEWDTLGGLISGTTKWHSGKPIKDSVGHGYFNNYRTIMAYRDVYGSAGRVLRISNPSVDYYGLPTGTSSRNAASGMTKIATDKVQYNSACYPAKRNKNKWGKIVGRSCNLTAHCAKWKKKTIGRKTTKVCVAFKPD